MALEEAGTVVVGTVVAEMVPVARVKVVEEVRAMAITVAVAVSAAGEARVVVARVAASLGVVATAVGVGWVEQMVDYDSLA